MDNIKKENLIVGRWYTSDDWVNGSYAKYLKTDRNQFVYSENIYANIYYKTIYDESWSMPSLLTEVSIEDLKQYLPKDYDLSQNDFDFLDNDIDIINNLLLKL